MLGQAVPQPVRAAPTVAQAQALYDAAVNFYHRAEWDQAEAQTDALLAMPGLHAVHEVAALNLKATLAARTHRLELAVSLYQAILKRQPAHVEALSNLGLALQKLNRHEQALGFLKQAVQHRPGHANSQLNLGLTYQSLGQLAEARAAYQRTLAIEPDNVQARFNIAKMLQDTFDFEAASQAYQAALDVDPRHADSLANLIFVQHYRYPPDEAAQQALIWRVGELNPARPAWPRRAADKKPLRVGLVSADLRKHPVGYFLRDVLLALASTAVASGELTLLAYANQALADELTQDIRPVFVAWHTVDLWNDARLDAQIRSDEIDILVDLSGRTAGNRLPVFARHPAPVRPVRPVLLTPPLVTHGAILPRAPSVAAGRGDFQCRGVVAVGSLVPRGPHGGDRQRERKHADWRDPDDPADHHQHGRSEQTPLVPAPIERPRGNRR